MSWFNKTNPKKWIRDKAILAQAKYIDLTLLPLIPFVKLQRQICGLIPTSLWKIAKQNNIAELPEDEHPFLSSQNFHDTEQTFGLVN